MKTVWERIRGVQLDYDSEAMCQHIRDLQIQIAKSGVFINGMGDEVSLACMTCGESYPATPFHPGHLFGLLQDLNDKRDEF